jgi:8-oxo-dGTP pyrophosphatase MutT (NUDIX family)
MARGEREAGPAAATAAPAATVVLARDGAAGIEVLLLERHGASRFAPGAFAFPGGRIEAADAPAGAEGFCRGLTAEAAARTLRDVEPPAQAIGYWIGVLRELFEETGLLLTCGRSTGLCVPEAGHRGRLAGHRARSRAVPGAFIEMLVEEDLRLATDRLVYYAHWITPEERPVRYDARFFVGAAPADATPEPDGHEIVGYRWLGPQAAIEQARSGEITVLFVTRAILQSMTPYPDVPALLAAARTRDIRPIRPRIVRAASGAERILLPGDPGYF